MDNATAVIGQFRLFAARILNNPHDREAIAAGFELIASSIEEAQALIVESGLLGCQECGQPVDSDELPAPVLVADLLPVIDPLDLPDFGADTDATVTEGA